MWVPTDPAVHAYEGARAAAFPDGHGFVVWSGGATARTDDYGRTWTSVASDGASESILGPAFVSERDWYAILGTKVARTADSGSTWATLPVPNMSPTVRGMELTDARSGIAAPTHSRRVSFVAWPMSDRSRDCSSSTYATAAADESYIMVSSDGGSDWRQTRLPYGGAVSSAAWRDSLTGAISVYEIGHSVDPCAPTGSVGTHVLVTRDGGRSWADTRMCHNACLVAWSGPRLVLAETPSGRFLVSHDFGGHFRQATAPSFDGNAFASALTFAGNGTGYAVVNGRAGGVLRSNDGGQSWQRESLVPATSLPGIWDIAAFDESRALLAGPEGVFAQGSTFAGVPMARITPGTNQGEASDGRLVLQPALQAARTAETRPRAAVSVYRRP